MITTGSLKPKKTTDYTQDVFTNPSTGVPSTYAQSPAATAGGSVGAAIDPSQTSTLNGAALNLNNVLSGIAASKPMLQSAYGYNDQGNVDPSNPFSRASLLQKNYQTSQKDNTNSYAAKGQLYAGSLQNAQNTSQSQYQQGDAQLRGEYAQQLAALAQQQAAAQLQYGTTADGANLGAAGTAVGTNAPVTAAPAGGINSQFAAGIASGDPATLAFIQAIAAQQSKRRAFGE